jgi:L,D-peptidoglycan transpeptidase YkuD (ErfK/YbiS/YcfS/YnhG family)
MHIARPAYGPTEGCIALAQEDLVEILRTIDNDALICITEE